MGLHKEKYRPTLFQVIKGHINIKVKIITVKSQAYSSEGNVHGHSEKACPLHIRKKLLKREGGVVAMVILIKYLAFTSLITLK